MSRLTDLISHVKSLDPQAGADLEREFRVLASRRSFGLNFERHRPEAVELPQRGVRKGDKVRVLPKRGTTSRGDQRLWLVKDVERSGGNAVARLELFRAPESELEFQIVAVEDLVVVAEFRDMIYPGLVETGGVQRGNDKPFQTVINGENYHVLKALTYTHRGKVDVVYIDPPYNSGARDWKYNNDYVESEDLYRHSKWLAFIERRLLIAKELLNPEESVLIVTIDEKEYLRLGLLLEQLFPDATIQMISSIINPKGTARTTFFSRTDEYIFVAFFGSAKVPDKTGNGVESEVRWRYLRRTDVESARGTKKGGPAQFYPIYVNDETCKIELVGKPLGPSVDRTSIDLLLGCTAVFPIREEDGMEMNWGLTGHSLKKAISAGYVRVTRNVKSELQPYVFAYMTAPNIRKIEQGILVQNGKRDDGSWIVVDPSGKSSRPTTTWNEKSHEAGAYGTTLLREMLPGRKFPYPKSLYAVEDILRLFVGDKRQGIVVDFFAGSGTTAHAVMRLNHQDCGERQCILVTNNEVAADEQADLRLQGLRPGDSKWEQWGICDFITKPRVQSAITGNTPNGTPIKDEYKFADEFPMSEGFEENARFFTLTYESPLAVSHDLAFERIAPLLWMRAGSRGRCIKASPTPGWEVVDSYGLINDLDCADLFCAALEAVPEVHFAYIVTDDDRRFQSVARRLPEGVEPVRLYESYLSNFRFASED